MRETKKKVKMEEGLHMGFKEVRKNVRIESSIDSSVLFLLMVCFMVKVGQIQK